MGHQHQCPCEKSTAARALLKVNEKGQRVPEPAVAEGSSHVHCVHVQYRFISTTVVYKYIYTVT